MKKLSAILLIGVMLVLTLSACGGGGTSGGGSNSGGGKTIIGKWEGFGAGSTFPYNFKSDNTPSVYRGCFIPHPVFYLPNGRQRTIWRPDGGGVL